VQIFDKFDEATAFFLFFNLSHLNRTLALRKTNSNI